MSREILAGTGVRSWPGANGQSPASRFAGQIYQMGMARSVDAEIAIETALPSSSGRMPQVWSAGGGLSLGGPLGASDYGAGECGGETGAGVELAGNGSAVRCGL